MYSNAKQVAPAAFLILILCVLNTDQTLFSFRKSTTTSTAAPAVDNVTEQTGSGVSHKEPLHWWKIKYQQPTESTSESSSGSNQIAVAIPLMHHKLQSIIDAQLNSDVKWLPCLCPTRKGDHHQLHQLYQPQQQYQQQPPQQQYQQQPPQQQYQQQPQPQPQQQQQQQQPQQQNLMQYGPPSSYYPSSTTQAPEDIINNNVPRFILANYPIEA